MGAAWSRSPSDDVMSVPPSTHPGYSKELPDMQAPATHRQDSHHFSMPLVSPASVGSHENMMGSSSTMDASSPRPPPKVELILEPSHNSYATLASTTSFSSTKKSVGGTSMISSGSSVVPTTPPRYPLPEPNLRGVGAATSSYLGASMQTRGKQFHSGRHREDRLIITTPLSSSSLGPAADRESFSSPLHHHPIHSALPESLMKTQPPTWPDGRLFLGGGGMLGSTQVTEHYNNPSILNPQKPHDHFLPPHRLLFGQPKEVCKHFNFFVVIFGIKCRNLPRSSLVSSSSGKGYRQRLIGAGEESSLPATGSTATSTLSFSRKKTSPSSDFIKVKGPGCVRTPEYAKSPGKFSWLNALSSPSPPSRMHSGSRGDSSKALGAPRYFVIVNWDDYSYYNRTSSVKAQVNGSSKWPHKFQFQYSVNYIEDLASRFLTLSIYEDDDEGGKLVGFTEVDVLTIATAPIQHDIVLLRPEERAASLGNSLSGVTPREGSVGDGEVSNGGSTSLTSGRLEGSDNGRIVFYVYMSQLCHLIINPIEILVSLTGKDISESEEGDACQINFPKSYQSKVVEKRSTDAAYGSENLTTSSPPNSNYRSSSSTKVQLNTNEPDSFLIECFKKVSDEAVSSDFIPPGDDSSALPARVLRTQGMRKASAATKLKPSFRKLIWESEVGEKFQRRYRASGMTSSAFEDTSANQGTHTKSAVSSSTALPGFTKGLYSSALPDGLQGTRWQLSFSPTGVENPAEYFTIKSELNSFPYWNNVRHNLIANSEEMDMRFVTEREVGGGGSISANIEMGYGSRRMSSSALHETVVLSGAGLNGSASRAIASGFHEIDGLADCRDPVDAAPKPFNLNERASLADVQSREGKRFGSLQSENVSHSGGAQTVEDSGNIPSEMKLRPLRKESQIFTGLEMLGNITPSDKDARENSLESSGLADKSIDAFSLDGVKKPPRFWLEKHHEAPQSGDLLVAHPHEQEQENRRISPSHHIGEDKALLPDSLNNVNKDDSSGNVLKELSVKDVAQHAGSNSSSETEKFRLKDDVISPFPKDSSPPELNQNPPVEDFPAHHECASPAWTSTLRAASTDISVRDSETLDIPASSLKFRRDYHHGLEADNSEDEDTDNFKENSGLSITPQENTHIANSAKNSQSTRSLGKPSAKYQSFSKDALQNAHLEQEKSTFEPITPLRYSEGDGGTSATKSQSSPVSGGFDGGPNSSSCSSIDQLDVSQTYHRLAQICRQGHLVREFLNNDLPFIQLLTSIEVLRRNHLHIRLYTEKVSSLSAKSSQYPSSQQQYGNGYGGASLEQPPTNQFVPPSSTELTLYGETWLPFFKLYDADVVDQVDKHFFDSYFHEKLWSDGKCIGHIQGIIIFQNNPIVRQMYAGVHTEHGVLRMSPPILGTDHKSVNFNIRHPEHTPPEILALTGLHKQLLDLLFSKTLHHPDESVVKSLVYGKRQNDGRNAQLSLSGDQSLASLEDASPASKFLHRKDLRNFRNSEVNISSKSVEIQGSKEVSSDLQCTNSHPLLGAMQGASNQLESMAFSQQKSLEYLQLNGGKKAIMDGSIDCHNACTTSATTSSADLPSSENHLNQEKSCEAMGLLLMKGDNSKKSQSNASLQGICESILTLLKASEIEGSAIRSFVYNDEASLLTAQRVLLNLANHTLEYGDYVLWQFRGMYMNILQHILRRGELEIGTCLPQAPNAVKHLDLEKVWLVYQILKLMQLKPFHQASARAHEDFAKTEQDLNSSYGGLRQLSRDSSLSLKKSAARFFSIHSWRALSKQKESSRRVGEQDPETSFAEDQPNALNYEDKKEIYRLQSSESDVSDTDFSMSRMGAEDTAPFLKGSGMSRKVLNPAGKNAYEEYSHMMKGVAPVISSSYDFSVTRNESLTSTSSRSGKSGKTGPSQLENDREFSSTQSDDFSYVLGSTRSKHPTQAAPDDVLKDPNVLVSDTAAHWQPTPLISSDSQGAMKAATSQETLLKPTSEQIMIKKKTKKGAPFKGVTLGCPEKVNPLGIGLPNTPQLSRVRGSKNPAKPEISEVLFRFYEKELRMLLGKKEHDVLLNSAMRVEPFAKSQSEKLSAERPGSAAGYGDILNSLAPLRQNSKLLQSNKQQSMANQQLQPMEKSRSTSQRCNSPASSQMLHEEISLSLSSLKKQGKEVGKGAAPVSSEEGGFSHEISPSSLNSGNIVIEGIAPANSINVLVLPAEEEARISAKNSVLQASSGRIPAAGSINDAISDFRVEDERSGIEAKSVISADLNVKTAVSKNVSPITSTFGINEVVVPASNANVVENRKNHDVPEAASESRKLQGTGEYEGASDLLGIKPSYLTSTKPLKLPEDSVNASKCDGAMPFNELQIASVSKAALPAFDENPVASWMNIPPKEPKMIENGKSPMKIHPTAAANGANRNLLEKIPASSSSFIEDSRSCEAARSRLEALLVFVLNLSEHERNAIIMFHKRMNLCKQFFLLMHRMLFYSLNKVCSDTVLEGQKKYISIFLSIAYFRLPVFREELLNCLLLAEEMSQPIDEWRGSEYDLEDPMPNITRNWHQIDYSDLQVAFDWTAFHRSLRSYFGEEILHQGLKGVNDKNQVPIAWKSRLQSRGPLFFSLLEHWSRHIYHTLPRSNSIRWRYLPGYAILLKAFLLEMKKRDITKYPDSLLNCSSSLLANERLLSVFIKVVFLRTSVHKTSSVFAALNYVDYWIQVLKVRGQPVAPNFDFNFLKKGLEIVLRSEICLNVAKGIWFVYKNLFFFQKEKLRVILINVMMNKNMFIKCFLSWSYLARKCYIWFILYRVCEGARLALNKIKDFHCELVGPFNDAQFSSRYASSSSTLRRGVNASGQFFPTHSDIEACLSESEGNYLPNASPKRISDKNEGKFAEGLVAGRRQPIHLPVAFRAASNGNDFGEKNGSFELGGIYGDSTLSSFERDRVHNGQSQLSSYVGGRGNNTAASSYSSRARVFGLQNSFSPGNLTSDNPIGNENFLSSRQNMKMSPVFQETSESLRGGNASSQTSHGYTTPQKSSSVESSNGTNDATRMEAYSANKSAISQLLNVFVERKDSESSGRSYDVSSSRFFSGDSSIPTGNMGIDKRNVPFIGEDHSSIKSMIFVPPGSSVSESVGSFNNNRGALTYGKAHDAYSVAINSFKGGDGADPSILAASELESSRRGKYHSSRAKLRVLPSDLPTLSFDERVFLRAYHQLVGYLRQLGIPPLFSFEVLHPQLIPELISRSSSTSSKYVSSHSAGRDRISSYSRPPGVSSLPKGSNYNRFDSANLLSGKSPVGGEFDPSNQQQRSYHQLLQQGVLPGFWSAMPASVDEALQAATGGDDTQHSVNGIEKPFYYSGRALKNHPNKRINSALLLPAASGLHDSNSSSTKHPRDANDEATEKFQASLSKNMSFLSGSRDSILSSISEYPPSKRSSVSPSGRFSETYKRYNIVGGGGESVGGITSEGQDSACFEPVATTSSPFQANLSASEQGKMSRIHANSLQSSPVVSQDLAGPAFRGGSDFNMLPSLYNISPLVYGKARNSRKLRSKRWSGGWVRDKDPLPRSELGSKAFTADIICEPYPSNGRLWSGKVSEETYTHKQGSMSTFFRSSPGLEESKSNVSEATASNERSSKWHFGTFLFKRRAMSEELRSETASGPPLEGSYSVVDNISQEKEALHRSVNTNGGNKYSQEHPHYDGLGAGFYDSVKPESAMKTDHEGLSHGLAHVGCYNSKTANVGSHRKHGRLTHFALRRWDIFKRDDSNPVNTSDKKDDSNPVNTPDKKGELNPLLTAESGSNFRNPRGSRNGEIETTNVNLDLADSLDREYGSNARTPATFGSLPTGSTTGFLGAPRVDSSDTREIESISISDTGEEEPPAASKVGQSLSGQTLPSSSRKGSSSSSLTSKSQREQRDSAVTFDGIKNPWINCQSRKTFIDDVESRVDNLKVSLQDSLRKSLLQSVRDDDISLVKQLLKQHTIYEDPSGKQSRISSENATIPRSVFGRILAPSEEFPDGLPANIAKEGASNRTTSPIPKKAANEVYNTLEAQSSLSPLGDDIAISERVFVDDDLIFLAAENLSKGMFKALLDESKEGKFIARHTREIFHRVANCSLICSPNSYQFTEFLIEELASEMTSHPGEALKKCLQSACAFSKHPKVERVFMEQVVRVFLSKIHSDELLKILEIEYFPLSATSVDMETFVRNLLVRYSSHTHTVRGVHDEELHEKLQDTPYLGPSTPRLKLGELVTEVEAQSSPHSKVFAFPSKLEYHNENGGGAQRCSNMRVYEDIREGNAASLVNAASPNAFPVVAGHQSEAELRDNNAIFKRQSSPFQRLIPPDTTIQGRTKTPCYPDVGTDEITIGGSTSSSPLRTPVPYPPFPASTSTKSSLQEATFQHLPGVRTADSAFMEDIHFSKESLKIPEESVIYIRRVCAEFKEELVNYRDWILSGSREPPALRIPVSPLDYNVDVPFDTW